MKKLKNLLKTFLATSIISISLSSPVLAKGTFGLRVGDTIPAFNLESDKGKMIDYKKNFRGKVLLLVVANYCSKDLAGVWTAQTFYRFAKNKDFAYPFIFYRDCVPGYVPNFFVAQAAANTAETIKVPYFLMDWKGKMFETYKGNKDHSHIYVVDREGVIRWKKILTTPFVSPKEMDEWIVKLLNEK